MASSLFKPICDVKGEVKLQSASIITLSGKFQPGLLRLSKLSDSYYMECLFDTGIKPVGVKPIKVCSWLQKMR